jgi:hypothetical protein
VLTAEEARELLDSIDVVRNTAGAEDDAEPEADLVGLSDRALCVKYVCCTGASTLASGYSQHGHARSPQDVFNFIEAILTGT